MMQLFKVAGRPGQVAAGFMIGLMSWFSVAEILAAEPPPKPAGPPPGAMTDQDPSAYQGMSPEQIARVKKGEIVILDQPTSFEGRQLITAAFFFNQDIDTVWNLMTQGWRQEEYLPRLERSPLIKKWDGGDQIEFQLSVAGVEVKYRVIGTHEKSRYYCSWKLDPSFDND